MKKKLIMALSTAFVAAALCGTMASCGKAETKNGEYAYPNAWNTASNYGVKVSVDVKGDKIQKVTIVDSDYTVVSGNWDKKAIWEDGIEEYLAKFEGMKVADVLAAKVTTNVNGQPDKVEGVDFITGATQGSGRLVLAIQNALGAEATPVTYTGEYHYNSWGHEYGVKVAVDVYGGKIVNVAIVDSDYVVVSDSWDKKATWNDNVAKYLESFKGVKVADFMKATVTTNVAGVPSAVAGADIISGATQGSGRVVLAMQNALGTANKVVEATAYGLVHGAGYVGVSTADVKGDKLVDLTLTEVCFPTYVTSKEPTADTVTDNNVDDHGSKVTKHFYKTVAFGNYEFTYQTAENAQGAYVDADGKTLVEVFADEAACKAYYDAVVANKVSVKIGDADDTTIMCAATLSKEENGYWNKTDADGNTYSRWMLNRDATVAYALENGADSLTALVKVDGKWMDGDVDTGATWNDLNSDTKGKYYSYAELIVAAYDAACGNN